MLLIRRVYGRSMEPALRHGRIVIAVRFYTSLRPGHIVVVRHNGMEKIKRIREIKGNELFVVGDNLSESTDSRHFGWVNRSKVLARVILY